MPTESATYNYLSCAAKIDNLLHPRCGFLSDGGWEDLDTVRKRALVVGWTSPTKTADFCPEHSRRSMSTETPAGTVRRTRAAEPVQPSEPAPSFDQQ